jgi:acyl-CoA thioester hydrolase
MSAFTHHLRVRYNECDPQGIVFNANYLTYVDLTVTELWRARVGGYQHFVDETGVDIVVAEASLRFRAAARFDDEIAITLTPGFTSESSITTPFTIDRAQTLLIEGSIRHVCVDAAALTKVAAPARLRDALGR